jgi:CBS domain-containing protein
MKAREIMTTNPACCTPDDTVQEAARLMAECDCGLVPVVDDTRTMRLVGVVTDRDLAVRALAKGRGAETRVRDVMTSSPRCCGPDDDVRDVERAMADNQVRRVPIIDERGHCVGVVAQADLARAADRREGVSDREVARVVEKISEPSRSLLDWAKGNENETRL